MAAQLELGSKIPTFSLKDHEGDVVNSEDIIGSPLVIYFYPKDDTPGCTKEACSFRDVMEQLDDLDALIIGISPDNPTSHAKFIKKYQLNFTLLSDETFEVARQFGVIKEGMLGDKSPSIIRSTFLIDSDGVIRWLERSVSVDKHAERVIEALHQLV